MMTSNEWELCGVPVVERAKREVLADVRAGRVPADVDSFASLHDFVDANEYGGACEGEHDGSDATNAFWNRVQGEVDAWIKAGGIKAAKGDGYDPVGEPIDTREQAAGGGPW